MDIWSRASVSSLLVVFVPLQLYILKGLRADSVEQSGNYGSHPNGSQ